MGVNHRKEPMILQWLQSILMWFTLERHYLHGRWDPFHSPAAKTVSTLSHTKEAFGFGEKNKKKFLWNHQFFPSCFFNNQQQQQPQQQQYKPQQHQHQHYPYHHHYPYPYQHHYHLSHSNKLQQHQQNNNNNK